MKVKLLAERPRFLVLALTLLRAADPAPCLDPDRPVDERVPEHTTAKRNFPS